MADRVVDEGTCQFCFRRQAVRPDRKNKSNHLLALHGYRLPGWGYTVGSCPGVDHQPYQESCDFIVEVRAILIKQLDNQNNVLKKLRDRHYLCFKYDNHSKPIYDPDKRWQVIGYEKKIVHRDADSARERSEYEDRRILNISRTESFIARLIRAIEERTKQIDYWKRKPLGKRLVDDSERKRATRFPGVSQAAGTLIGKIAKGLKSDVADPIKMEALSALGWTFRDQPVLEKIAEPESLKAIVADLADRFKAEAWGYSGVKATKEFWLKSKQEGEAFLQAFRQLPFVAIGVRPTASAPEGTLFVGGAIGPYEEQYTPGRWRVQVKDVTLVVSKKVAIAPDGGEQVMEGAKLWTFGYKHGLKEAAVEFIKQHSSEADESGDEQLEVLDPPEPDLGLGGPLF